MDRDQKRQHREEKRVIKRLGNQRVRRKLKRLLVEDPENAVDHAELIDYGPDTSAPLNGNDRDATRHPRAPRTSLD